ncbi:hypothetical protein DID88_000352 [Monilinia fructigena]|uniref:Uncharacterized protein n=1 Tax=Monilinia fructigena TaxID=38457 RepID=A0A395IHM8_9HELO|nr:hypothetical protein DID88_000352 [Monilinia fructigena]
MDSGSQLDEMGYRGGLGSGSAMAMGEVGMGYRGTPPPGPGMNRGPGQLRGGPSPAPSRAYDVSPLDEDFEQAMPQEFPSNGGFNDAPVSRYGNQPYPPQPSRQFSNESLGPLNPGRSYTSPQNGGYRGPQERGFNDRSPVPIQQPVFGQEWDEYNQGSQRNMTRSPPQQQTPAYPGYKPYSPEPEPPTYPGYKPYSPDPEPPTYPGYKPYTPAPR